MKFNHYYVSFAVAQAVALAAVACAPVAPSLDKSKFLTSKQEQQAPGSAQAEKKQVIVRSSGTQFELSRSWIKAADLEAARTRLQKTDAILISFTTKDGSLQQLLGDGAEFTSAKVSARKLRLLLVEKEQAAPKKDEAKAADEKPAEKKADAKKDEKAPKEAKEVDPPLFSAFSTTDPDASETQWWIGLDTTSADEIVPSVSYDQIESAVLVIYPSKAKAKNEKADDGKPAASKDAETAPATKK